MISQAQLEEGSAIVLLAQELRRDVQTSSIAMGDAVELIYRQAILIKQLQIEVAALQQKLQAKENI